MSTRRERDVKDALDEYIEDGEGGAQMFLDILHRKGLTVVSVESKRSGTVEPNQPVLQTPTEGQRRIKRKGF